MINLPKELNELRNFKQWVGFKFSERKTKDDNTKLTKTPINPYTGNGAKVNEPETWGTFDDAEQAMENFSLDGIGFVFANGYAGIDLDHVIFPNGELEASARSIVEKMDSYTEYSPSGEGLHILFKLDQPLTKLLTNDFKHTFSGREIYDEKRYFTVTGNIFGNPKPMRERSETVKAVYCEYFTEKKPDNASQAQKKVNNQNSQLTPQPKIQPSISDSELWDNMFNSSKGYKIKALFNGDTTMYNDNDNAADLALCNHLAYWTKNNPIQIDRMFRETKLMRPKWDEIHNAQGQTYGEMTIDKAINHNKHYDKQQTSEKYKTQVTSSSPEIKNHNNQGDFPLKSVSQYLNDSWQHDVENFRIYSERKTGFDNLDTLMGTFYPGLYVLGAIPSLGKTTFINQMSDHLAENGEHVLFFSLEQPKFVLCAKGISRTIAKLYQQSTHTKNIKEGVSALELCEGFYDDIVAEAKALYMANSQTKFIIEGDSVASIDDIIKLTTLYIEQNSSKPTVVIDYLQFIASDKDSVDSQIKALKQLQIKYGITIIVISSFNRQNYLTPIDFESFKESGGIEYTADVLWGLQPKIIHDPIFHKKEKTIEKRKAFYKAKSALVREVELVCLKNRFGKIFNSCNFKYYTQFDYFVPEKLK